MVMYPLICYNHGTCIIYSCLNVLTDRTSSRSTSVVVSVNIFKKFIRMKGRETQINFNWKVTNPVKNWTWRIWNWLHALAAFHFDQCSNLQRKSHQKVVHLTP